jgi:hypothetical protein
MAHGTKGVVNTGVPSPSPALTPASLANAQAGIKSKKQKKRQKAGGKPASPQNTQAQVPATTSSAGQRPLKVPPPLPPLSDDEDLDETDDEDPYVVASQQQPMINGHGDSHGGTAAKKKNKKKKKNKAAAPQDEWAGEAGTYDGRTPMPHEHSHGGSKDRIWNTSSHEERERIKDFWRGLGEGERKSLLKVEKDTVIKTMKEQQKHSCSCTVCGRKRHAIEEELEVLYDAYYSEIEQYALDQVKSGNSDLPYPMEMAAPRRAPQRGPSGPHNPSSSQGPPLSDDEEYDDEEDYEDDDEALDSDEYSYDQEDDGQHRVAADLRIFGNSLEIEGNTVRRRGTRVNTDR